MSAVGVILWCAAVLAVLFVGALGIVGAWLLGELVGDARAARKTRRAEAAEATP